MLYPARILVVEDEPVLAENLGAFLARSANVVRVAYDGESALQMLKFFSPEMVVLDYALPGMDGLRTCSEIIRASPRPPGFVMISGFMTDMLSENARRLGIGHLLCKPFSFADLQYEIDLVLGEREALRPPRKRLGVERRIRQLACQANRRSLVRRNQPLATHSF